MGIKKIGHDSNSEMQVKASERWSVSFHNADVSHYYYHLCYGRSQGKFWLCFSNKANQNRITPVSSLVWTSFLGWGFLYLPPSPTKNCPGYSTQHYMFPVLARSTVLIYKLKIFFDKKIPEGNVPVHDNPILKPIMSNIYLKFDRIIWESFPHCFWYNTTECHLLAVLTAC